MFSTLSQALFRTLNRAALLLVLAASSAAGATPPNIVLIVSDDQAWTDYGFMGHPHIATPHLDRLAARSVVFPRGHVTTPLCRPSLMSIVTGRYAFQHGVTGNDPSPRLADLGSPAFRTLAGQLVAKVDRFDTLPELLGKQGYLSFQTGKWWEGSYARAGFTHGMSAGDTGGKARHGDAGLVIGREGISPIVSFVDAARKQRKPFFVWYAPLLPHTPHNPPERLLERHLARGIEPALARYYAMCEWFDETCGELLGYLDREGLRDNTLVAFVCDNGWIQPTPRTTVPAGWSFPFAPGSKLSPREAGVRTPILFSWPGVLAPSIRTDLVSSIDLLPTLLSAAGATPPSGLPGEDLWDELRTGAAVRRQAIFGDAYAHDIADLDNPEASLLHLWCIEGEWKLILSYDGEVNRYAAAYDRSQPVQLYNLGDDPHETRNLAAAEPARVGRMRRQIEAWYPLRKRRLVEPATGHSAVAP